MIQIESGTTDTANPMVLIENLFAVGVIGPSSEESGFEAENVAAENTFDGWKPVSTPGDLQVQLTTAAPANAIGVAAHNLGSKGATLVVQYNPGSGWIILAEHTPVDDSPILILFPEQTSDLWRIRVLGAEVPTINYLMLGKRVVFATGIIGDYTPTNWGETLEILGGETNGGQFLGQRIIRRGAETRVSLGRVTKASFALGGEAFFKHYNQGKAFFFAGYPAGLLNDVALCWRPENMREINPAISEADWVGISFGVRCHVSA